MELIAGWDGLASLNLRGVDVKLFRSRQVVPAGFSGLAAPSLLRYLMSRAHDFDVVHVHMARDLITLPGAARLLGIVPRLVIQTHGMIMPDPRLKARLLDWIATRRVLRAASVLLALTQVEANGLREVARVPVEVSRIPNGVHLPERTKANIGLRPQVLFLARLHPRKRVMAFAEMALILTREGRVETFHVVGPDEGDLQALQEFIAKHNLSTQLFYEGSIESGASLDRLREASVFVLPSVGEVFPMAVLEALSVGTPVVITEDCGLADDLKKWGAGQVTDGTPRSLAEATRMLLTHPDIHKKQATSGVQAVRTELSIEAVVDQLESLYVQSRN